METKSTERNKTERDRKKWITAKENDIQDDFGTKENGVSDRIHGNFRVSMGDNHIEEVNAFLIEL